MLKFEISDRLKKKSVSYFGCSTFAITCENVVSDFNSSCNLIYTNFYCEVDNLADRISFIDNASKKHLTKKDSFREFIKYSLDLIESKNNMHQTKLERVFDEGSELYRFTFYLETKRSTSLLEEQFLAPENKVYNDLLKDLFKRDKELRLEMVLDERSL